MNEISTETARLIEAVLFIENDAVSGERLSHMMNLPIEVIEQAVQELHETYQPGARGVTLSQTSHGYQLIPSPELHEALRNTYGKRVDRRLTRAALETLSIIAYAQPVTRRDVENIRGVSSDSIMRMLLEREYIHVVGRKDVPGHPGLYGTTRKFLLQFGLNSISDLPRLSELDRQRFLQNEEEKP